MNNPHPFPTNKADMDTVRAYMARLFRGWDWTKGGHICIRGIGEKGTRQDGKFRENKFIDPRNVFGFSQIETHLNRWAENSIASFVLPGIVDSKAAEAGHATEDMVRAFCAIMLDIDNGNVVEKMEHCMDWLGEPSMVINSGGITDIGHNKVHAYWVLNEPTTQIVEIGRIRKLLAAKVGGDQSFGRPAQVIRIAGSAYGKGGVAKPVQMVHATDRTYDLSDLIDAIESMEWMEGCLPTGAVSLPLYEGGAMDFSPGAGVDFNRVASLMTTDVHAGGVDGATRWDTFNAVAGHHIHCIRTGAETAEEAKERTWGWALEHMKPVWDRARFDAEWAGLLNKDVANNGELPTPMAEVRQQIAALTDQHVDKIESVADLLRFRVDHNSTRGTPPAEKILVNGFFMNKKRHLFVGDGAVGKTYVMMDLALRLAAASEHMPLYWLGQPIGADAYGGTVILIMAEDGKDDLDRRWHQLDPDFELRDAAGERLIALPMSEVDGGMPQAAVRDPRTGEVRPSANWLKLLTLMKELNDSGQWISAVVLDTLNSTLHGEENSAAVINEFITAVSPICGAIGAAMIVTHHIGKGKADAPIRDLDDMKRAIRGSSALPAAMRVVTGMWVAHDWQKQLKLMGLPQIRNSLLCMGILKANSKAFDGIKYLYRSEGGVLVDVSHRVANIGANTLELQAWLKFAIAEYAARYDFFFQQTGTSNGLHKQREYLPPIIQALGRNDLQELARDMIDAGQLIKVTVKNHGTSNVWLDTAERIHETRQRREMDVAVPRIDWQACYYDSTAKVVRWYAQQPAIPGD